MPTVSASFAITMQHNIVVSTDSFRRIFILFLLNVSVSAYVEGGIQMLTLIHDGLWVYACTNYSRGDN